MDRALGDNPLSLSLKRLTYLVGLPVGAGAVAVTWLLLLAADDLQRVDAVLLPTVGLLALVLAGLYAFTPVSRRLLDATLYLVIASYLLVSTAPQLLAGAEVMSFAKAGLWFPTFSLLFYLLFGAPLGRWLALLPAAALLLLWVIGAGGDPDIALLAVVVQVAFASGLTVLLVDVAMRSSPARRQQPLGPDDPLTGLPGRDTLLDRLVQELGHPQARLSLIMLQIDDFAGLDELHGPDTGNAALGALAGFVANGVREAELVGRWNQDTFLVMVARTEAAAATTLAERLRREVMRRPLEGLPRLTVSVGVAVRHPSESVPSLVARAERALDDARLGGGDQVMLDSGDESP